VVQTPFKCLKLMFQMGYDPADPFLSKAYETSNTARVGLRPVMLARLKGMKDNHTLGTLFTGARYWALEAGVSTFVSSEVKKLMSRTKIYDPEHTHPRGPDEGLISYELKLFGREFFAKATAQCAGSICAFPLTVLGTRVTAQIVGGESVYSQFYPTLALRKLVAEEGWDAVYGLLALHLAGDVVQVFSSLITTRLAENYARPLIAMPEDASDEDKLQFETFKNFIASWVAYEAASPFWYPIRLAETLLIVNGCPIAAGQLPFAPPISGFWDTMAHLWTLPNHRGIFRGIGTTSSKLFG